MKLLAPAMLAIALVGVASAQGLPDPFSPKEVAAAKPKCQQNDMDACNLIAHAYENGVGGMTVDYTQAVKFRLKACELGSDDGCYGLAVLVRDGQGITANLPRARSLLNRSCWGDGKNAPNGGMLSFACYDLAVMLAKGEGGPKDKKRAIDAINFSIKVAKGEGFDEIEADAQKLLANVNKLSAGYWSK